MTSKKSTVIISAILTIIGMIVFAILQFELYRYVNLFLNSVVDFYLKWSCSFQIWASNNNELLSQWDGFGKTIFSGIFTSALVTFLIARGDYLYERKRSLENMHLESEELQRAFMKIKYILPDEPKKLVCDLLGELESNNDSERNNRYFQERFKDIEDPQKAEEMYNKYYSLISHKAEIKFKDYLWEHTVDDMKKFFTTPESKEEYLDKECKNKIEKYTQELEEVMKSYIIFKDVRTKELTAAYGNLNFVFANKSIRKHIFENLYDKQIKQVNEIRKHIFYFESYFKGNGESIALLFDRVWELQTSLISEDKDAYYRQYLYDVDCEIVQTLIYANGKVNPEEIPNKKHYLISSKPDWFKKMLQVQSEE